MINEFQKFPDDKEAYDKNYDRVFGPKEKQANEETKFITETLSNIDVREELGLPNKPEECDLCKLLINGCPLNEAKNKCKGCIIGRVKNED